MRFPLFAAALAGLAAGCADEWSALKPLKPPPELIKLDTWTNVPEGQQDVSGRVGDVFHLSLGKGMDCSQLGWMRVIVNTKGQEYPEFDTSAEPICYVFRAAQPGRYRLEIRREIVTQIDPDANPDAEPEPPRRLDKSWPPRVWNITITE